MKPLSILRIEVDSILLDRDYSFSSYMDKLGNPSVYEKQRRIPP
jgi:hypothetical protein